jgi:hypothetical protein
MNQRHFGDPKCSRRVHNGPPLWTLSPLWTRTVHSSHPHYRPLRRVDTLCPQCPALCPHPRRVHSRRGVRSPRRARRGPTAQGPAHQRHDAEGLHDAERGPAHTSRCGHAEGLHTPRGCTRGPAAQTAEGLHDAEGRDADQLTRAATPSALHTSAEGERTSCTRRPGDQLHTSRRGCEGATHRAAEDAPRVSGADRCGHAEGATHRAATPRGCMTPRVWTRRGPRRSPAAEGPAHHAPSADRCGHAPRGSLTSGTPAAEGTSCTGTSSPGPRRRGAGHAERGPAP